jgi:hypothetical protein
MLFIILIIGLYIGTIGLNKKTIEDYSNINERDKNLNNLRGILWASYITTTIITIYLLIKLFSKTGFYYNKSMFIITILILLLNTGLTIQQENILRELLTKINTENNLNNIYVMSTIMTVINVISLLTLMYTNEDSKIYKPDYETIQYEYTQEGGKILPSLLRSNKPIRPTKNVSYENVFQNKPIKSSNSYISQSLMPSKNVFQGAVEDSYINPLLLQNKVKTPPKKIKKSSVSQVKSNRSSIPNNDVYVNPILL